MIAMDMGIKQDQIFQILDRLVTNGFIKIETTIVNGKKQIDIIFTPSMIY